MKKLIACVVALPLVSIMTGCLADPSHAKEADELRDRLADLPGVSRVSLDYAKPITLDSGKVNLEVTMAPGAPSAEIAKVVATTYKAFAGVHHGEEGDLDVVTENGRIHLRSFEPTAKVAAVAAATERAAEVMAGGKVLVNLNTQWVKAKPHVRTTFTVTSPAKGAKGILAAVASMEEYADVPRVDWRFEESGEFGSVLGTDGHYPTQQDLDQFVALGKGLPAGSHVSRVGKYTDINLGTSLTPDEATQLVARHLKLLGFEPPRYYYVLTHEGDVLYSRLATECEFAAGAVGQRLKQDHGAGCTAPV